MVRRNLKNLRLFHRSVGAWFIQGIRYKPGGGRGESREGARAGPTLFSSRQFVCRGGRRDAHARGRERTRESSGYRLPETRMWRQNSSWNDERKRPAERRISRISSLIVCGSFLFDSAHHKNKQNNFTPVVHVLFPCRMSLAFP
jgi:hypothetical protein